MNEPTYGGLTIRELRDSIHSRGRAVKALPDLLDAVERLERRLRAANDTTSLLIRADGEWREGVKRLYRAMSEHPRPLTEDVRHALRWLFTKLYTVDLNDVEDLLAGKRGAT